MPRLAFLAFNDEATLANILRRSDDDFVRVMNFSSASEADTYVYATDGRQDSLVRKLTGKRPAKSG